MFKTVSLGTVPAGRGEGGRGQGGNGSGEGDFGPEYPAWRRRTLDFFVGDGTVYVAICFVGLFGAVSFLFRV